MRSCVLWDTKKLTSPSLEKSRSIFENELRYSLASSQELLQHHKRPHDEQPTIGQTDKSPLPQPYRYEMAAAAGFYQSVVGFILVMLSNLIVRKLESGKCVILGRGKDGTFKK